MPLATAVLGMNREIGEIASSIPKTKEELQSWNLAEKWGNVAKIFFASSVIPMWTPVGLDSGKALWISTALSKMSSPQDLSISAMESAFKAFASLASVPGNVVPPPPAVIVPPIAPLILMPLGALPPSPSPLPSTIALHGILLAWALTGTQTIPPALPVPWS
ncbi:MAG: hypothetical protein CL582_21840 [Alteromonadaceae bacterium]|nr:hypothetical protein [Alteromonadaceae bacterium]|tara:strand:- start:1096 stop:1581 length:486 start_codon:yes stop_codon:yes gene_type:complete